MASPEPDELIEVYHTDLDFVARKILDVLLRPEGIGGVIHDRKDAAFPAAGQPGALQIAVARKDHERALQVLTEATENGFLDENEGEVIQPEG